MVDRDDDLKIGIKSTAVFFGKYDKIAIATLHALSIAILIWVGVIEQLGTVFYLGLAGAVTLFAYQQWLIRDRQREGCFKAFLNNHDAELLVLLGIIAAYW
jgi:4-hydroxybenzoate polyprenyltransferase